MQESGEQKTLVWPIAVFTLAFLLRLLHIAAVHKNSPFFDILPGDLSGYDQWAVRIVEHGWLGREIFYQDPLYPYFLAVLYKIFGRDFFWIYLIQAFFGACSAMILVPLGRRILNPAAGIIAGLLYAFYGPAIYFDGLLLKVTLAAFLLTLSVYLFLRRNLHETRPGLFFSGLFLGLTCLTRANFLIILPVLITTVLLNPGAAFKKRIGLAFLILAGTATALGPVVARNYYVGGELVLTTAQAGQNFYIGNNPQANGTYIWLPFVRADVTHEQADFKNEAERRAGREFGPAEVSRYWFRQGLDYLRENPLGGLELIGRKLLLFCNNYEIPDNLNYYFQQRYSTVLQILPLGFGLLAPFILLGFAGMAFERRTAPLALLLIQAAYIFSVVIFYVLSRYRMAAMPMFCLSAGFGISMLLNQFRMGQWRKFGASLLIAGCGFWISNIQIFKPLEFTHSFYDEGVSHEMRGEPGKAMHSYEQALAINPGYLRVLNRLGRLQLEQKDYKGARRTYTKILELVPGSIEARFELMRLDKLGL